MARAGLLIGEVATRSGVSPRMLRRYETLGLLPRVPRTASGYRLYGPDALDVLTFVTRARALRFTLDEIREIVAIRRAGQRPCAHVRQVVQHKVWRTSTGRWWRCATSGGACARSWPGRSAPTAWPSSARTSRRP